MGIIDEIGVFNIYKSFISDLKKWKEEEKIIEDYAFIPYDWRVVARRYYFKWKSFRRKSFIYKFSKF